MLAEIITIGDEILIGQIVDSNSAFIARELNKSGISVYQITSVQDDEVHILEALKEASTRAQVIILTGGLGPTKDDITKQTLCRFFQDQLVQDQDVLAHIEELFKKYISTPISDLNRKQALVPSRAQVLHNPYGTAPGLWNEKDDVVYVSLPGVPFEMKHLFKNEVIPLINERFDRPHIYHKTLITYGLGESGIALKIDTWANALPDFIKLAYLPNLGKVRLRLTAKGDDPVLIRKAVEEAVQDLYPLIGDIIYGEEDGETIEVIVGKIMAEKGLTLATAESFTGGKIAEMITSVPGASTYFLGSVVSYATDVKKDVLGISAELIEKHSVVSAEVAMEMAVSVKNIMKSDFAIATTGNAGPTKGDSEADIGTVYIAIATPGGVIADRFTMGNHRTRIVRKAVHKALEMLRNSLVKM
ncbi:MAG: competence/damage-inducible protein A [Flavobacteriaceae bacterium]|nr:competence/damage-inducible protein A [Flavobacteriaceae bacterium]